MVIQNSCVISPVCLGDGFQGTDNQRLNTHSHIQVSFDWKSSYCCRHEDAHTTTHPMEEGILLNHEKGRGILTPAPGRMILDTGSGMPQDHTQETTESFDPQGQEVGVWVLRTELYCRDGMCWKLVLGKLHSCKSELQPLSTVFIVCVSLRRLPVFSIAPILICERL